MPQQSPSCIIEKRRLAAAKKRARARLDTIVGADFLLRHICEDLALRLGVVQRSFEKSLLIAPKYNGFSDVVGANSEGVVDLVDEDRMHNEDLQRGSGNYDLIVSIGQLHLVNDVPGVLVQLRHMLKPDGLLLACVPGAKTLENVRSTWSRAEAEVTGGLASRFLPLFDVRTAGSLLQRAGFALPVTDSDAVDISYRSTHDIFADLRSIAGGNVLTGGVGHMLPRTVWSAFNSQFEMQRDETSRLHVTFELIWMSGWAPSPTQAKPLKPGSAEISLTKVLKQRQK